MSEEKEEWTKPKKLIGISLDHSPKLLKLLERIAKTLEKLSEQK